MSTLENYPSLVGESLPLLALSKHGITYILYVYIIYIYTQHIPEIPLLITILPIWIFLGASNFRIFMK